MCVFRGSIYLLNPFLVPFLLVWTYPTYSFIQPISSDTNENIPLHDTECEKRTSMRGCINVWCIICSTIFLFSSFLGATPSVVMFPNRIVFSWNPLFFSWISYLLSEDFSGFVYLSPWLPTYFAINTPICRKVQSQIHGNTICLFCSVFFLFTGKLDFILFYFI